MQQLFDDHEFNPDISEIHFLYFTWNKNSIKEKK